MDPSVVILADGDVDSAQLAAFLEPHSGGTDRPLLIAADGAAGKALAAGVRPDIVIGDGDSLTLEERVHLEGVGVELRWADPDKNESDTELCLLAALAEEGARITILGALGGDRPEHAVANLLLLADPRLDGRDVDVLDGGARLWRMGTRDGPGVASIKGT
ncbi:MAG: thiamine diphosphokinase, partial [Chloroflexota bacterium]